MAVSFRIKPYCTIAVFVLMGLLSTTIADTPPAKVDNDSLHDTSIQVLKEALEKEKGGVKIHAAEALIYNNYIRGIRETFLEELEKNPSPTYKVGIWRVLAAP